jgi:HEAT repeat protein
VALARFGPASYDILEEATRASDTGIRLHAIDALGLLKDPRALPLLASLLRDPDRQIVKQSVRSLVMSRSAQAALILQPYAADRTDRELSMLAREALTTLEKTVRK